ncbi:MAG: ABC transporter permease [Candidatus Thermoplasmatota archaeon]|nr:ABC transporter permease [Candidatus Thermoplasmatota archaeon]MCL5437620.1 ABC transporter permease [Candidatus Thermoplasmatota archaeon]
MSGLMPLFQREIKKWYKDPIFFFVGMLQPLFWIALFGSALDFSKFVPSGQSTFGVSQILDGAPNYITFVIAGVLTTTALFTGIFAGTNIIWDRRLGTLSRFLISPIRRSSIVFTKIFASIVRILVQAVILIAAALIIPNGLVFQNGFNVFDALVVIASITMIAFIFSSIFSLIAIRMTKMNSIFGIINLINLPLMFASYAMFSKSMMASWLGNIAQYNPVSWSAQAIRMVIVNGSLTASQMGTLGLYLLGLFVLTVILTIACIIASEKEIRE